MRSSSSTMRYDTVGASVTSRSSSLESILHRQHRVSIQLSSSRATKTHPQHQTQSLSSSDLSSFPCSLGRDLMQPICPQLSSAIKTRSVPRSHLPMVRTHDWMYTLPGSSNTSNVSSPFVNLTTRSEPRLSPMIVDPLAWMLSTCG